MSGHLPTPDTSKSAGHGRAMSKADTDLTYRPRALWIGVGGDVHVRFEPEDTVDVVYKNVPTGSVLDIAPIRLADGTTATDITSMED